jgi:hypothetical protein
MSSWFIGTPPYYSGRLACRLRGRTRKSAILIQPAHPGQTHFFGLNDYTSTQRRKGRKGRKGNQDQEN